MKCVLSERAIVGEAGAGGAQRCSNRLSGKREVVLRPVPAVDWRLCGVETITVVDDDVSVENRGYVELDLCGRRTDRACNERHREQKLSQRSDECSHIVLPLVMFGED